MQRDFESMKAMNELNTLRRDIISAEAGQLKDDIDKIRFIASLLISNYEFDYSVLFNEEKELERREPREKEFTFGGKTYIQAGFAGITPDEKYKIPLSPSVHALRLGTCAYFSNEMLYFAKEFGIDCARINVKTACFDYLCDKNGNEIINELRPMMHYYNVFVIDGVEYKVDIAGALMAKDWNRVNKDKEPVSIADFILVDPKSPNPFDAIYAKQMGGEPGGE